MPRGDKSSYTDKQKRMAEHIEEGYEERGTPKQETERRAWATVNKESGGGNKSGSGRGPRHQRLREKGRPHRRQGFRQPAGRGAKTLREKGRRNPQAQRHQAVGGQAQDRAEEVSRSPDGAQRNPGLAAGQGPGFRCAPSGLRET